MRDSSAGTYFFNDQTDTHTHIHIYTHICIHAYTYTHTHMYIYIYKLYIHIYIYIHTHIHMYIHTNIHTLAITSGKVWMSVTMLWYQLLEGKIKVRYKYYKSMIRVL